MKRLSNLQIMELIETIRISRDMLQYFVENNPDSAGMGLIALNKCDYYLAKIKKQ